MNYMQDSTKGLVSVLPVRLFFFDSFHLETRRVRSRGFEYHTYIWQALNCTMLWWCKQALEHLWKLDSRVWMMSLSFRLLRWARKSKWGLRSQLVILMTLGYFRASIEQGLCAYILQQDSEAASKGVVIGHVCALLQSHNYIHNLNLTDFWLCKWLNPTCRTTGITQNDSQNWQQLLSCVIISKYTFWKD